MKKKKVFVGFLCLTLCTGMLSACGKENTDTEEPTKEAEATPAVSDEGTPTPVTPTLTPTPESTTPIPTTELDQEEDDYWWEKYEALAWYPDIIPSYPHEEFLKEFSYGLPEVDQQLQCVLYPTEIDGVLLAEADSMPQYPDEGKTELLPEDYDAWTLAEDAVFFIRGKNKAEDEYQYAQVSREVFLECGTRGKMFVVCGLKGKEILYVFEYVGP